MWPLCRFLQKKLVNWWFAVAEPSSVIAGCYSDINSGGLRYFHLILVPVDFNDG